VDEPSISDRFLNTKGKTMTCDECGLPISVCNTLALYRYAVDRYEHGNFDAAREYVRNAKISYEEALRNEGEKGEKKCAT
jgi:hypothetical protein